MDSNSVGRHDARRASEPLGRRMDVDGGALVARAEAAEQLAAIRALAVAHLREALIGVAEREIPADSSHCYCVRYAGGPHDEWCGAARRALASTADDATWTELGEAFDEREAAS